MTIVLVGKVLFRGIDLKSVPEQAHQLAWSHGPGIAPDKFGAKTDPRQFLCAVGLDIRRMKGRASH